MTLFFMQPASLVDFFWGGGFFFFLLFTLNEVCFQIETVFQLFRDTVWKCIGP